VQKIIQKVKDNNNNPNRHNMIYLVFRYISSPRDSAHGSPSYNNPRYENMNNYLNSNQNKKYKIGITEDCGTYKKGYTNDGYIGCITIWEQE